MTPSVASARDSLTLAAQILAAQRAIRGEKAREERENLLKRGSSRTPPTASNQTLTREIVRVLLDSDQPLLAPEIRKRLAECREKSLAPALNRLMHSGAIRRQGREGKYRYTSD